MKKNRNFPWYDTKKSFEERVELLIAAMTPREKISQMLHTAPAIPRLGIPSYNWWNEALHGVARAGLATVFPQSIGLAATFDDALAEKVADAVSTEGRAKYHAAQKIGNREQYFGLTYWTPNINIFRDPRWGRGQETYGEDPCLTGRMGSAFVRGLQGKDKKYLKSAACAKHFLAHSGPENLRHSFNAEVSPRDMALTYAPAFKKLVTEAEVEAVMGAYNRTNGEVCCGSRRYITKMLRGKWKFKGHFVSDCWAVRDFHENHKITSDMAQSAACAVKNGCDLNCGCSFEKLTDALKRKLIAESDLDAALRRLFMTRMKLGMFDDQAAVPYSAIPASVINCEAHRKLALKAARESVVLLKNNGILPLKKDMRSVALTGPNANSIDAVTGNYNGWAKNFSTVVSGVVSKVSPGTMVDVAYSGPLTGTEIAESSLGCLAWTHPELAIVVLGLNAMYEGEEGNVIGGGGGGDKESLELPECQRKLVDFFHKQKIPVVAVVMTGSPVDLRFLEEKADAILQLWYPGEAGGEAAADVLFGDYNPAGRLPVTFPMCTGDLPEFTNYSMANRTYRYAKKTPLYPFGYGLSYTKFRYSAQKLEKKRVSAGENARLSVQVKNAGKMAGDEVVQLYMRFVDAEEGYFNQTLIDFKRIHLKAGEKKTVSFVISPEQLEYCGEDGVFFRRPGKVELAASGGQIGPKTKTVTLEIAG